MDYSRYKTIKIDIAQNVASERRSITEGFSFNLLNPMVAESSQKVIVNTLQQEIADQTKLEIVEDDNANLRVGFYLSKFYQGRSYPYLTSTSDKNHDALNESFDRLTMTAIVHVAIKDNVLNKKQEFDVSYNSFDPNMPLSVPPDSVKLPKVADNFLSKLPNKVADEILKRILERTK